MRKGWGSLHTPAAGSVAATREEPPHRASTGALVPSPRAPGVSRAAFERSGDVARAGRIPPIAWRERSRRGSRAVEV